jgi:predicted nucleic acid-binding protein
MYLIDTNIVSEQRKGVHANGGVRAFFQQAKASRSQLFLSAVTVGELRRGIELIHYRGDVDQAARLSQWLDQIFDHYASRILDVDTDIAQMWGRLRAPHQENPIDKLIAATALVHGLVVVTRNERDFLQTGVKVLNPFSPDEGMVKE